MIGLRELLTITHLVKLELHFCPILMKYTYWNITVLINGIYTILIFVKLLFINKTNKSCHHYLLALIIRPDCTRKSVGWRPVCYVRFTEDSFNLKVRKRYLAGFFVITNKCMFWIQNQFKTISILKLSQEQKCPSAVTKLISWFREISSVRGWASRQAECAHDALSVCCRRQIRPSARQHSITDETTGSSNCLQQSIQYQRVADCTRLLAECRLIPTRR